MSRPLILAILACSSVVALAGTAFQLATEYRREILTIEQRVQGIGVSDLPAIARGVWMADNPLMQAHLDAVLRMPDLRYAAILDNDGETISVAGTAPTTEGIERRFALSYRARDREMPLGTLVVSAGLDGARRNLRDRAVLIVGAEAIKIFLVAACAFLVLHLLVIRHLRSMADYVHGLDLTRTEQPFALARRGIGKRRDEFDEITEALNDLRQNMGLATLLSEVKAVVNVLADASVKISASTTQVAAGTAESATAISETTTTVEEVRQAAQLSSQKAQNVADSAQRLAQVGQTGQKAVEEVVAGMANIRMQMESIAATIVRLSEQSQSIGGIIAAVTDIADQSNLLAVNAAIEATRAGEQGKAFGVVAQEIKSLAEQSKQATLQVRAILSDVQRATSAAVMATEQGSKSVEAGVRQSAQAGEAITRLAESSETAVQTAQQIVASSQQQVVGMDQIGLAMESVNKAGAQTAASTIQVETAARNLDEMGQKLKALVEQFKG